MLLKHMKKWLFSFLLLTLLCICRTEVYGATQEEAESESYSWTSIYAGKEHYMLNLPITNWKSSAPANSRVSTKAGEGADFFIQNGFVANPATWNWTDVKKLTLKNSAPFVTIKVNGKSYDAAEYGAKPGSYTNTLTFTRFEGTFYIDPSYDISGMQFSTIPVSENPYIYCNVDMYIFIYPKCIQSRLSNSGSSQYYFMNYMTYWCGTQMIWPESQYFQGVQGLPLTYYKHKSEYPNEVCQEDIDPFARWDWVSDALPSNATPTVNYGWNQVKDRSDYDGEWCMTIIYAGNSSGSTYRMLIGAEFDPVQILYDGNGATDGKNYIQKKSYGTTAKILENRFTRTGYTFTGWNTKEDGTGQAYRPGASYSTERPVKLFAQWKQNTYIISYHGNGATRGEMPEQVCKIGQSYSLSPNVFEKTGYTFVGWAVSPDGKVVYPDQAMIKDLVETELGVVDLYAKWTPIQYTIRFDANGGTGSMPEIVATYDEALQLPDNTFTKSNEFGESYFAGWNLTPDTLEILFGDGTEVHNLTEKKDAVVTLYAIWDDCPWIIADDLYYTLEQAQNGFITYDELMEHATAQDREAGTEILPGVDEKAGTTFTLIDYQESDFTQFEHAGSTTETYEVVDNVGNTYQKTITIHVVDTAVKAIVPAGTTRFINENYYNATPQNGGLLEKSIWKMNSEYAAAILESFCNMKNHTPEQTYYFTREVVLEMQMFIMENGLGNVKNDDALQVFYEKFMVPARVNQTED